MRSISPVGGSRAPSQRLATARPRCSGGLRPLTAGPGAEYDAFGIAFTSLQTPNHPSEFAGKHGYYNDGDSGMLLLGHCYYLPALGRFLTQDPLGHDGGLNLYGYNANGNLQAYASWVHGAENRLGLASVVEGGTSMSCGYRADGLRAWRTWSTLHPDPITYYLYDGTQVVCELDASGGCRWVYGYGAHGIVQRNWAPQDTGHTYSFDP